MLDLARAYAIINPIRNGIEHYLRSNEEITDEEVECLRSIVERIMTIREEIAADAEEKQEKLAAH